ncbi:MAG TPA: FG-GAP-like repeat-containing protein [Thermoanaerobaculia bacterium]|nr:FG-GAP-like repeat-containing protein [Thermoanaerobaculia bacterium]
MSAPTSSPRCALAAGLWLLLAPALASAQNGPPYKPGFPLTIPGQGAPGSDVLPVDLGLTPGFKSILYGLLNGKLYVIRRNGAASWGVAAGWPQTLPSPIHSNPAVGDLNGNGTLDIVVGFGYFNPFSVGGVRAFDRNGNVLWTASIGDVQPGPGDGMSDPVVTTPAIGDVDGDGTVEVVFGGLDHRLHVVNGENGLTNNPLVWPKDLGDTVFSSPALHDMDADGRLDIVVGSDRYQISGGRLWVLNSNGQDLPGFPKDIPDQVVSSSPAIGDIDGDGQPEIVHGTGNFTPFAGSELVYAWNCDGSPVAGWPVRVSGQVFTSPALANLDGDAPLEVVVTSNNTETSNVFRVYGLNGNGGQIFSTVVRDFFNASLSAFNPVVGDAFGADTATEILVPTNREVAIFSNVGVQLTETDFFPDDLAKLNLMTQAPLGSAALTDLETNGAGSQIEVIAVSAEAVDTVIHVWNPINRTSTPPWPFLHQNERRAGVAPGTTSCGNPLGPCPPPQTDLRFFTLPPCRAVDTRNAAGPLGGPALVSNASRSFDLTGVCGVPASARAVSLNVTVTQPTGQGHVVFSPGCAPSGTSAINFGPGQTRANNTLQPLSAADELTATPFVLGNGFVHLIIDVNGFFE